MAELSVKELSRELREAIENLDLSEGLERAGIVVRVGDGVAWVHGLREAGSAEILEIETNDGGGSGRNGGSGGSGATETGSVARAVGPWFLAGLFSVPLFIKRRRRNERD